MANGQVKAYLPARLSGRAFTSLQDIRIRSKGEEISETKKQTGADSAGSVQFSCLK